MIDDVRINIIDRFYFFEGNFFALHRWSWNIGWEYKWIRGIKIRLKYYLGDSINYRL
jgi:hypothetical protein